MSEQFARYEQDLINFIKSCKTILADKIPIAETDERKSLIRQLRQTTEDITRIIEDMEMEMRKFGPNSRASMNNKLKQYKLDVDIIQKEMKKAIDDSSKYRNYQSINQMDPERSKLLQIHSSLMNTNDTIARSTQIAIETEQLGNNVLTELNEQGERLRNANDQLDDTKGALLR
ncbi:vesicle transport through interaction with t-SNAREs -like protein, partial [Brachionus plicatilis]